MRTVYRGEKPCIHSFLIQSFHPAALAAWKEVRESIEWMGLHASTWLKFGLRREGLTRAEPECWLQLEESLMGRGHRWRVRAPYVLSLNLENLHPAYSISAQQRKLSPGVCVSPGSLNWSLGILTDTLADPNPAAYTVTMLWWEDHFLVSLLGDPTPHSKALTSQKSGERRNPSKSQQGWRTSSGRQALKSSALQFIKCLLGRVHQREAKRKFSRRLGAGLSPRCRTQHRKATLEQHC